MKNPRKGESNDEKPEEPFDFDLDLGPEDEADLLEKADRNYREWMKIIGEESPD